MSKICGLDWSHTKGLFYYVDDKVKGSVSNDSVISLINLLKKNNVDVVATENTSTDISLSLYKNFKLFRCSGKKTAEFRDKNQIEKTDENDAMVLKLLFEQNPDVFYEYEPLDIEILKIKSLVRLRDEFTKSKARTINKYKAYSEYEFYDFSILNDLTSTIKMLENKIKNIESAIMRIEYFRQIYNLFDIKGANISAISSIVVDIGNVKRFKNKNAFLAYCFGYHIVDKEKEMAKKSIKININRIILNALVNDDNLIKFFNEKTKELTIRYPKQVGIVKKNISITPEKYDCRYSSYDEAYEKTIKKYATFKVKRKLALEFYFKIKNFKYVPANKILKINNSMSIDNITSTTNTEYNAILQQKLSVSNAFEI